MMDSEAGKKRKHQLKIVCPDPIFEQLKAEKVLQNSTMQDLVIDAVEIALRQWALSREYAEDAQRDTELDREFQQGRLEFREHHYQLRKGEDRWMHLWLSFMREVPEETVSAAKQLVQDTLRYFQRSRLKKPETIPNSEE